MTVCLYTQGAWLLQVTHSLSGLLRRISPQQLETTDSTTTSIPTCTFLPSSSAPSDGTSPLYTLEATRFTSRTVPTALYSHSNEMSSAEALAGRQEANQAGRNQLIPCCVYLTCPAPATHVLHLYLSYHKWKVGTVLSRQRQSSNTFIDLLKSCS